MTDLDGKIAAIRAGLGGLPKGPYEIGGVSLNDGTISFRMSSAPIVLGYVTNACSFGDFVQAAVNGNRDFGAPDTAVTQHRLANHIARLDPQTVAAILDRLERAESALRSFIDRLDKAGVGDEGCDFLNDEGGWEELAEIAAAARTALEARND